MASYTETHALCHHCQKWLALDQFYKRTDPRFRRPVRSWCKACELAEVVARHKAEPDKRHARQRTNSAIRAGKLVRQPCEVCGAARSQAHHDDYSRPLDVRWLCSRHHQAIHRVAA